MELELDNTEIVFDFEINAFNNSSGEETSYPFININGEMIHDDELKRLLRSDKKKDKKRRKQLVTDIIEQDYRNVFKYILFCGYKLDEILNDREQTALHLTFYNNPGYLLEPNGAFLVPNCTSDINHTDSKGLTHLHVACVIGNIELVKKLLENKSINVNAPYRFDKGDYGRGELNPLHFAVLNLRLDIVKLLLENGADVHATDFLGRTPLHIACGVSNYRPCYSWTKDWKIVEILVKHQSKVNALDNYGNTPLLSIYENYFLYDVDFLYRVYINDTEYQRSELSAVDLIKAQSKKLEILMSHGADISVRNRNGNTIIHCIINDLKTLRTPSHASNISFNDAYHTKIIQTVISADSKQANLVNNQNETPLLLAVSYLSLDIVKILLKCDIDLKNFKFDDKNQNCFKHLCIVPNFETVKNLINIQKLLLSKGYNMSLQDNLVIFKFFTHDFDDCKCRKALDSYDILFKIMNLLYFGSTAHIKHVLKSLDLSALAAIEDSFNYLIDDQLLKNFVNYLRYMEYADLYLDQQVKDVVNELYLTFNEMITKITFEKPAVELRRLKSKKLRSNISLHEIMMKHPHDVYHFIKDLNFGEKYLKDFPVYGNIIKGHSTRAIIRNHLEQSMYPYIEKLLFPLLPDSCCHEILYYLSNEDVLNVAIAISYSVVKIPNTISTL